MDQTNQVGNEQVVSLEIPSQLSGSTISPLLFGHNFEITRKASWQGLSAEMLANRKFAAVGANGLPLHWTAIGIHKDPVTGGRPSAVTLDSTTAYAGKYSLRVALADDGGECGISQAHDRLTLEQGRHYRLHVWVRADEPVTVIVRVKAPSGGQMNSLLFEVNRDISPAGWQDVTAEFTASRNEPAACFEVVGVGSGVFNIGAVSLQNANVFHGMRRDVIECLKAMWVGILRYPGGCFSEYDNWKDGLLPVDARPPIGPVLEDFLLPNSDRYDTHEIGIDDFMVLCGELGCEASITVRIGEGSPEEAASWVEYCNGGKDTKWGRLRIERGHSEPYGVKYWSLGNEISAWGKGESKNVERYGELCKEFAQAMRRVDPTIRLIGSGMHGVHEKWPLFGTQAWTEGILARAGSILDAYSYHEYTEPLATMTQTARTPLKLTHSGLEGLRATINQLASSPRSQTIFYDEWNLWDAWNRTPGVQEALFAAVTLHMLCREADQLGIEASCYFQPVNEGAIRVLPTTAELTPVGRVFSTLTTHAGKLPVKASGSLGPCDIFASLSSDGRSLTVTAINVEEQSSRVSFRTAGASIERVGAATAYAAKSNVASSDVVRSGIEVVLSDKGTYSVVLPALSFAKIEFQIAKSQ
jgi:alpha-N-arabinofuranosidase